MGWDAYSSVGFDWSKGEFTNKEHEAAFKNASDHVIKHAGTVDALLDCGSLDCSNCARMLQEATGKSCWDEKGWDETKVKILNKTAQWNFKIYPEDAWAYWSARKFLEVCSELNLSIRFSW